MKYDVKEILKTAIDQDVSDIFFVAGSPYAFMIKGIIQKVGDDFLRPADTEDIIRQLYELEGTRDFDTFVNTGDDDYSFSLPGVGRFRVNAYRQRNSLAATLRVVRFGIPDYLKLGIPDEVIELHKAKKGMIIVSGPWP